MSNEESFNENSASDQTTTKMASYADATKTENDKSKAQNSDFGFSAAKPVFILETDLFGTIKPKPVDFLNHAELRKKKKTVIYAEEESHLKGLQRVNGMWRIYLDSESDREHLIANGLTIRKKHIHVHDRNPKFVVKEHINYLRIRIKNVPLSADDNQIGRYLETKHNLIIHNFNRERLRINGFLTNCQTGDRLFMVSPVPGIQLPRFISIGKYKALLIHKDQIVVNPYAKCNKCLQTGHKQETCDNDWVCNSCGKSGHKAKECQQPMDDPTADQDQNADSIVTDSVPEAANIDNAKDETKDKQPTSESSDDSNDDSEDDDQQLVVHKEPEQITAISEQTNKKDKKTNGKKSNKNKSNKQNLPKSASGPLDHYMNFKDPKTPSQSKGKRQATTPTDELHKRVVEPTKQKTNP
ncbi:CNBP [Mytilus edulis]|uniref:CNBP n=1 Tax=Mytilus edulis TaxID=6550 RepID=A0A8S3SP02_MYTED|nr:CNBP [Mytilus edulis]